MTQPITIGRAPSCTIAIADETVSWLHAELTLTRSGQLFVTDCSSRNGTYLLVASGEKRKIRQSVVSPGDRLCFGSCEFPATTLLQIVRDYKESHKEPRAPRTENWERCSCGAVKPADTLCTVCRRGA